MLLMHSPICRFKADDPAEGMRRCALLCCESDVSWLCFAWRHCLSSAMQSTCIHFDDSAGACHPSFVGLKSSQAFADAVCWLCAAIKGIKAAKSATKGGSNGKVTPEKKVLAGVA